MTAIQQIRGTEIYSFTVDGKMDEAGITALYKIFKDKSRKGKIKLLAIFRDFDGFDHLSTLVKGIRLDFAAIGNIEKYALATDKKWVEKLAKAEATAILGVEMRAFHLDAKDAAVSWLKAT